MAEKRYKAEMEVEELKKKLDEREKYIKELEKKFEDMKLENE